VTYFTTSNSTDSVPSDYLIAGGGAEGFDGAGCGGGDGVFHFYGFKDQ
jgi:hypothetical protein